MKIFISICLLVNVVISVEAFAISEQNYPKAEDRDNPLVENQDYPIVPKNQDYPMVPENQDYPIVSENKDYPIIPENQDYREYASFAAANQDYENLEMANQDYENLKALNEQNVGNYRSSDLKRSNAIRRPEGRGGRGRRSPFKRNYGFKSSNSIRRS